MSTPDDDLLAGVPATGRDDIAALRGRLAARAEQESLLDVAYRTVDSPVGTLLLAGTPVGLVRIAYAVEGFDGVLTSLASRVSPRILLAPRRLDRAAREIDEYFRGMRRAFDLPLDRSLSTGFRRLVLHHLAEVDYGTTASYAAVAASTGNPKAVRAVGTACATNPLPIVVPCHRVVRSDGSLGAYIGGAAAKQALHDLEVSG